MVRKVAIGIGAFIIGFVLGSVLGFSNGVDYMKAKQAENQGEVNFSDDEPEQIDLEFKPNS